MGDRVERGVELFVGGAAGPIDRGTCLNGLDHTPEWVFESIRDLTFRARCLCSNVGPERAYLCSLTIWGRTGFDVDDEASIARRRFQ